jgi:hypothetical protein
MALLVLVQAVDGVGGKIHGNMAARFARGAGILPPYPRLEFSQSVGGCYAIDSTLANTGKG